MSNYPASLDSDSSLYVAHDYITTKLAAAQAIGDTVAVVANPTGWVANMVLSVDVGKTNAEQQLVTAVAGNVLTVTRAFGGTSASAHAANAVVGNNIDAVYQSSAKSAIIAIETALGAGLSNVVTTAAFTSSSPTQSSAFNFTPIVSGAGVSVGGGTLVVGNNAVTFSTVPAGVNGTDTQHYLYVSNGTGTAEACLITGGAGVAGASNGVIIINCAHTHSGSWTIQSASAGIKEASVYLNGGGTIILPKSTLNIYGTVVLPTTTTLIGQGEGVTGTYLLGASGVSPVMVMADAYAAHADGMGGLRDLKVGGSGQYGLWIGGDPSNVFAPSTWQGNYLRFTNILVQGPTTALVLYQGNFITFNSSAFSTTTPGPTMLVHSLSNGELQPVDFYGCLLTSDSGTSVQMDNSGFLASPIRYFGGQVSGPITGKLLSWQSFGTHYEPNSGSSQIVNATAADSLVRVAINGGQVVGLHGTPLDAAFKLGGGGGTSEVFFSLKNAWITVSSGTVTDLVSYGSVVGGSLVIEDNDIGDGSTFTNIYTVAAATYPRLSIRQPISIYDVGAGIAAASTLTFPHRNYPDSQRVVITGATLGGSGITAVAGLELGQTGLLDTLSAQTFTAGATIGNTITTTAGLPYSFYFDGTKIWVK